MGSIAKGFSPLSTKACGSRLRNRSTVCRRQDQRRFSARSRRGARASGSSEATVIVEIGFIAPKIPEPALLLAVDLRSEEHTSELQSRENLVCRLLLEKKKKKRTR